MQQLIKMLEKNRKATLKVLESNRQQTIKAASKGLNKAELNTFFSAPKIK